MKANLFDTFGINQDDSDRVFVIAEMSANHNHDLNIAIETVKAAKAAGADAIKLQTYTADTLTLDCDDPCFQIKQGTLWDGTTLYQLYKNAYMPWEWQPELMRIAREEGLVCFSSPFDKSSVDFLDASLDVPAYKIASFEITDIPLIDYVASKGKPVIISTGIATLTEIEEAVNICRKNGNDNIALLKCTSSYPAPVELINLRTIPDLKKKFNVPVGLSDHTLSDSVSVASVALGAKIIEKHFILDRNLGGPDATFSMNKEEFSKMVTCIREVEKALGKPSYDLSEKECKNRKFARSLFVVSDMKEGDIVTEENVRSIRPADGTSPKYLPDILGKKVNRGLKKGEPFKLEFITGLG